MQNTEKLADKIENEASETTKRWKNRAEEKVGDLEKTAGRVVRSIRDEAENVVETAQEYGQIAVEESRSLIKRYPGQSLLAGFGVGFLAGMLLSRR